MRTIPFLNREQIAALPLEQVGPFYEIAKYQLDQLLDQVQRDRSRAWLLMPEITATKIMYVLLRSRQYPKHFAKIYMAG